jgi:uncharacterized membrane protein
MTTTPDVVQEVDADKLDEERQTVAHAQFEPVKVGVEPYDSRRHEDQARRNIAYLLISLLIAICIASFVLVIGWPQTLDKVVQLIQIVLSPIVALVSAATGFYYGTKSKG